MSSWGPKLEKKLKALADVASKESIQTVANWVGFNRKHAAAFAKTLCDSLVGTTSETRQWLYWQVLSEILLASHEDAEKWEKAADLRTTLGEAAVIPALEGLGARASTDKIEGLWKQWDDNNVFGGPTLIGQIRRVLSSVRSSSSSVPSKTDAAAPSGEPDKASPPKAEQAPAGAKAETKNVKDSTGEKEDTSAARRGSLSSAGSAKHNRRGSLSSLPGVEIDYDFESKNIPFGPVDSREFLDPCRAVATLQIARDVRNDTPVQLNSMLVNLPEDIVEKAKAIEKGEAMVEDLDKSTIRDYSIRVPSKLLELDLEEQYQTIRTFQEIIGKQQTAREQLIFLLIKSRCQFGSEEAAKLFFELKETSQQLKKRKQLLVDALELEGLDAEMDKTDFEESLKDLPPLTWYNPDGAETDAKRQRVD